MFLFGRKCGSIYAYKNTIYFSFFQIFVAICCDLSQITKLSQKKNVIKLPYTSVCIDNNIYKYFL